VALTAAQDFPEASLRRHRIVHSATGAALLRGGRGGGRNRGAGNGQIKNATLLDAGVHLIQISTFPPAYLAMNLKITCRAGS
jgi:hypothetical protein